MTTQIDRQDSQMEQNPPTFTPPTTITPPVPPAHYAPYYYYPAPYQFTKPPSFTVFNALFWVFYALVGFWVDLSLTLSFWICALVLPFAFPLVVAVGGRAGLFPEGYVYTSGEWLYWQSDRTIYILAGITSLLGIMLLVAAILTIKPWFKLHVAMFRHLGGLAI